MPKANQAMEDLLRYNAAILPQKRSVFNKSHGHTTTCDSGYIIPLDWDRVLPGDEKKIRYSGLARMATPKVPVMDEARFDIACFFVPDRLVWDHAKEFYGENKDASFNPDGEYIMPYLKPSQYMVDSENDNSRTGYQSLNDYFNFPVMNRYNSSLGIMDREEYYATALLHRGYQLIWNEWYRNSSVQPALRLSTGDNVTDSEWDVISQIRQACKFPDYFTSLLKEPQAGDDVLLPLGDKAPVVTGDEHLTFSDYMQNLPSLAWRDSSSNFSPTDRYILGLGGDVNGFANSRLLPTEENMTGGYIYPSNLWADLTSATSATINNLRAAITVQQWLEISNLGGKRFQQILQAHFGTFTPDATLQRPELLGTCRQILGMRQVLQTSPSVDGGSPLGNTAAFSATNISNELICNKAFTEPGTIFVLGVIRPVLSYSQGLDPLVTKLHRFDHYWPVFDNLGNQPVPKSAIYLTDTGEDDPGTVADHGTDVLGYAEAWTEYRIRPNRVSGFMRPDIGGSLAVWNYSTDFLNLPTLNSEFVTVSPYTMERSMSFSADSGVSQFIIDSYFDYLDTKSMGVHSIPGLTRL